MYLPEKRGLRSRKPNTSFSIINELLSLSLITSSTVVTSQSLLDVSETQYGEVEKMEACTCLKDMHHTKERGPLKPPYLQHVWDNPLVAVELFSKKVFHLIGAEISFEAYVL